MCISCVVDIQIRVVGNWMSKIEGLVRRIVRLRQMVPEEKSLVFSQYPDALKLVGKALNVNNITWVELKGGSKVRRLMLFTVLWSRKCLMMGPVRQDSKAVRCEWHIAGAEWLVSMHVDTSCSAV